MSESGSVDNQEKTVDELLYRVAKLESVIKENLETMKYALSYHRKSGLSLEDDLEFSICFAEETLKGGQA